MTSYAHTEYLYVIYTGVGQLPHLLERGFQVFTDSVVAFTNDPILALTCNNSLTGNSNESLLCKVTIT